MRRLGLMAFMKITLLSIKLLVVSGLVLGFGACQKQAAPETSAAPEPELSATTPIPTIAVAPVATPAATPIPRQYAPEGVYFLIKKVSVTTDDGIFGLKPGTKVTQQPDGTYRDAEGHNLTLTPDQITNDLEIAGRAMNADAATQAALRQAAAQRNQAAVAAAQATPAANSTAASRPASVSETPKPTPQATGLSNSNSSLGATHTRIRDGYIWAKSASGQWHKVRRVGE